MKKGLACSAFDLLHAGHMLMLKDAKSKCDYLVVGLQIDPSITDASYRGKKKNRPLMSLEERRIMLEGIKYVDEIFVYDDEPALFEAIRNLGSHIRILGSDWQGRHATGQEFAEEIYYHGRAHDYSTTDLRERIAAQAQAGPKMTAIKFALYAHAGEVRLGEGGHVSRTDFFCADEKVHITRTTTWQSGSGLFGEAWSEPCRCDTSCKVWFGKNHGIPDDRLQALKALLNSSD